MIKRAPRQPRHRTRLAPSFQPAAPGITWTVSIVSTKARVVCSLPISIAGIPLGMTCQGVAPTAITSINPTTFDLTYASAPVSTNTFAVAANQYNVRGAAGGTLAAGTYTFP